MNDDALIGTLVDGRYRIDRVVGQGGFGTVYAAQHLHLGARVALKIPRIDEISRAQIPELVASFLEEGRMLRGLRHPHIVAALDVGLLAANADGLALPYLVLEWCEGTTLRDWLSAHPGARTRSEAWALVRPVLDAIAYAHARGLAHRDIKPANIILEPVSGGLTPRVIDFGIAKRFETDAQKPSGATHTTTARSSFTPKYAAPEQLAGLRTGPWTDVYALALLTLEVLAGRAVFPTDGDARARLLQTEALTPNELGWSFQEWDEPLARALRLKPGERFADASQLLQSLEASMEGSVALAPTAKTGSATGGEDLTQDHSVVPASRTLQTRVSRLSRRSTVVKGAIAVGFVALFSTAAALGLRHRTTSRSLASSAPVTVTEVTPAKTATPTARRELSSLTAEDLEARATLVGASGCQRTSSAESQSLWCTCCNLLLTNQVAYHNPKAIERVLASNGLAQVMQKGRAYRFARAGTWTLEISADADRIDALEKALVGDVAVDSHGREKLYPNPALPVPTRLADWKGSELGARFHAIGGVVFYDVVNDDQPVPVFLVDVQSFVGSDAAAGMLYSSGGKAMLAAIQRQKVTPYSFALDGDVLLMISSTGSPGHTAFMKKLLGSTRAEVIGESK